MDADMRASAARAATSQVAESEYVELAAEVFALLSDPTRIRILLALEQGELPVGVLAEQVGKLPAAVSQHLAKLRWAKMVQARHEGTRVYYSLIDEHAAELVHQAVYQAEHVVDLWPKHHLQVEPEETPGGVSDAERAGR